MNVNLLPITAEVGTYKDTHQSCSCAKSSPQVSDHREPTLAPALSCMATIRGPTLVGGKAPPDAAYEAEIDATSAGEVSMVVGSLETEDALPGAGLGGGRGDAYVCTLTLAKPFQAAASSSGSRKLTTPASMAPV